MPADSRGLEARAAAEVYAFDRGKECPADTEVGLRAGEDDAWPSLADRFSAQLAPFTDAEFEAATHPHPHAFQEDECGIAPIGEVTIVAAPGREGKTFATISLAVSYVLGTRIVGLTPQPDRSVIVYSAEDDRPQYARKVLAHVSHLGQDDAACVRERLIVPDLTAPGMEPFASLVTVADRQPIQTPAVTGVIEALRPAMNEPVPPGLLVFETASTLSDADEDNRSFKTMIKALRKIARELQVAVILVHHTSQQAATNLPELNLSVADIRGATALAFNARQCFLLVNLGSDEDPLPESDARSVLRSMAAPGIASRITALVCLDSSKAMDPPPIFFQWTATACGPALKAVATPQTIQGARWRKLQQMLRGERAERRQEAKDEARSVSVQQVVRIVTKLAQAGKQPTVRAISIEANHGPTWAKPYLETAVDAGDLTVSTERVWRVTKPTDVYRPAESTEAQA